MWLVLLPPILYYEYWTKKGNLGMLDDHLGKNFCINNKGYFGGRKMSFHSIQECCFWTQMLHLSLKILCKTFHGEIKMQDVKNLSLIGREWGRYAKRFFCGWYKITGIHDLTWSHCLKRRNQGISLNPEIIKSKGCQKTLKGSDLPCWES